MFYCKVHKIHGRNETVIAVCDKSLLGKELRKNPKFEVSKNFYFEKECDKQETLNLLEKCTIANLLGKEIVQLVIDKKFITEENVILIGEIPHAQIVK